jgi:hypothetical protein
VKKKEVHAFERELLPPQQKPRDNPKRSEK